MNNEEENIEDLESLAKHGLELFDEDYTESIAELLPNSIEQDDVPTAKVVKMATHWRRWTSVACILLVGAFGFWMLNQSITPSEALYANYVEVPPYVISKAERGAENVLDDLAQIENYYASGLYQKYISSVNIMENRPSATLLYEAISHMQLGQMEQATILLSDAQRIPTKLEDIRLWNLGLCYLQKKDYQKTKEVLAALTENYQYKRKEAQEILDLVENY